MNSVQKSSEIRNFCTEFLHFARSAKITAFCMAKSPVFVFFLEKIAFLIQTELPEEWHHFPFLLLTSFLNKYFPY